MSIDTLITEALERDIENPKGWDEFFEWLILQGVDVSNPDAIAKALLGPYKLKFYLGVVKPVIQRAIRTSFASLKDFHRTGFTKFFKWYKSKGYSNNDVCVNNDPATVAWRQSLAKPRAIAATHGHKWAEESTPVLIQKDTQLLRILTTFVEAQVEYEMDQMGIYDDRIRTQIDKLREHFVQSYLIGAGIIEV
jgi:hypothetical protein